MTKRPSGLLNLLPLLLFTLLAACVLSVLLTGTQLYGSLTQADRESYRDRTIRQFLCTKVRQAESPAAVTVEDFGGQCALLLHEHIDGQDYVQRIYCHDGWLRELFSAADSELSPEDGEALLKLSDFSASLEDGLLCLTYEDQSVYLDLTEVATHEE